MTKTAQRRDCPKPESWAMMPVMKRLRYALTAALMPSAALADSPEIIAAAIYQVGMDWRVDVTLSHRDTGWEHYADRWEVLDAQGNGLGVRDLLHPHVQEQPFTRSLHNIVIPDGTREVFVKARCNRDGWADTLKVVPLDP